MTTKGNVMQDKEFPEKNIPTNANVAQDVPTEDEGEPEIYEYIDDEKANNDHDHTEEELNTLRNTLLTDETLILKMLEERKTQLTLPPKLQKRLSQEGLVILYNLDISVEKGYYISLLMLAAEANKNSTVCKLLADGASINKKDNRNNFTALHSAARAGHVQSVKALLEHNPNLDIQNMYGDTPLHAVALSESDPDNKSKNESVEIIKMLVEAGAAFYTLNKDRKTPLDCMSPECRSEATRLRAISLCKTGPLATPTHEGQLPPVLNSEEQSNIKFEQQLASLF